MFPQRIGEFVRGESERKETSQISLGCPCGGDGFELRYDGTIQKHLLSGDSLVCIEADQLRLSAECPSCGRKVLLFDSRRHGYDAVSEGHKSDEGRWPEKRYACRKCGSSRFGVEMRFEYAGLEEVGEGLPKDECFSWLWVDIQCRKCGKKKNGFVDAETA